MVDTVLLLLIKKIFSGALKDLYMDSLKKRGDK